MFNCLFLQSVDSMLALVAVLAKDSHLFVIVFKKESHLSINETH